MNNARLVVCCEQGKEGPPMSWAAIIKHSKKYCLPLSEFWRFNNKKEMKDLEAAIKTAAMSLKKDGKTPYEHQWTPWQVSPWEFPKARDALVTSIVEIEKCQDFEDLHALITTIYKDTFKDDYKHSDKRLTVYDVAFRIGAWRKQLPEHIYIHADVRKGAKALRDAELLKVNLWGKCSIEVSDILVPELQQMPAWQVEDILCIYRKRFPIKT